MPRLHLAGRVAEGRGAATPGLVGGWRHHELDATGRHVGVVVVDGVHCSEREAAAQPHGQLQVRPGRDAPRAGSAQKRTALADVNDVDVARVNKAGSAPATGAQLVRSMAERVRPASLPFSTATEEPTSSFTVPPDVRNSLMSLIAPTGGRHSGRRDGLPKCAREEQHKQDDQQESSDANARSAVGATAVAKAAAERHQDEDHEDDQEEHALGIPRLVGRRTCRPHFVHTTRALARCGRSASHGAQHKRAGAAALRIAGLEAVRRRRAKGLGRPAPARQARRLRA